MVVIVKGGAGCVVIVMAMGKVYMCYSDGVGGLCSWMRPELKRGK